MTVPHKLLSGEGKLTRCKLHLAVKRASVALALPKLFLMLLIVTGGEMWSLSAATSIVFLPDGLE